MRHRELPRLGQIAENVVRKHRCPQATVPYQFRDIREERRRLGLDDWSGDISMVREALDILAKEHAECDQQRISLEGE